MKAYLLSLCMFLQAPFGLGQGALYTFSGTVSSLFYDGGGILAAHNVAIGDPVSASYVADFGAAGFYLLNTEVLTCPPIRHWATCIRLISTAVGLPALCCRRQTAAVRRSTPRYVDGVPYWVPDWAVQDWQVGTEVRGVMVAWSDQDWSIAWADMRLDSITAVPEPGVIPLFSIGGAALFLWGRRRANKITGPNAGGSRQLPMRVRWAARR